MGGYILATRLGIAIAALVLAAPLAATVTTEVGDVVAGSDGKAVVAVHLAATGGLRVGGLQNDLLFDSSIVRLASAAACRINPEIGDRLADCEQDPVIGPCKTLSRNLVSCDTAATPSGCEAIRPPYHRFRAILAATAVPNHNAIAPGTLLYTCTFDVVDRGRLPAVLLGRDVVASTPEGLRLDASISDGLIAARSGQRPPPTPTGFATATPTAVATATPSETAPATMTRTRSATRSATATQTPPPSRTISPTRAPSLALPTPARGPALELRASAPVGDELIIDVILHDGGKVIGGVQSDLLFDTNVVALGRAADCRINPEIGTGQPGCQEDPIAGPCKTLSRHLAPCDFGASACEGERSAVSRFRGIVAATGVPNNNPIPDATVLYSCTFRFTGDERSTVVRQRTAVASSPTGTRIEIAVEDEVIGDGDERLPTRTPGSPAPTRPPWTEVPTGPTGPMDSPFGGRIGVIVGPPHTLGAAPRHLAIGDFDNDGVQDVAISGNSDLIVTALSAGDGSFSALISLPTGRVAGDLSLLHANDDALLDIAAATYTTAGLPSGVLVLTHREPVSQPLVVSSTPPAARLFTADLDDDGDVDIATANQPSLRPGAPDISLMLNRGHNRGFDAAVDYDVAEWTSAPLDIEGADFDVDGDIDLLVLERSVEAPQHLIAFFHDEDGWRPQSILVGPHVVAMAVADIDVDGAADIILASSSTASPNHSIVVLRNDGRDDPAGDLSFTALPPVHWQCPVGGGGLPISCSVTDIGAGDFNADGLADVVAMIDTRLQDDVPLQTPGIAVFFDSVGAGELVFSTSVNVGSGPTEIAVGDVTGDAMPDVVVAETRAGTVSIVRSVRPPARSDGNPCYVARQCQSSSCVDGICCVSASCPDDKRCDIPGHSGACMTPSEDGRRCELAEHCASGACVDGFCCASAACPDGLFCNTGACALPAELGVACGSDAMCAGGDCVDGVCCEQQCPFGESCHIPSHEGQCAARLDLGDGCDSDSQCRSTACTDGVCCQVHDCGPGRSCAVAPGEGFCDLPPAPPPPPTTNPTPQPVGFPCDRPERCGSTFCVDGTCCDSTACPAHHYCDITIHAGHCAPRQELAACCNLDSDCVTGNCEYDAPERPVRCVGACAPPRTPTPRWPGSPCDSVEQCAAGFVCNHAEGGVCCDLERCPGGESCRVPGHEGLCRVVPTPTPVRLPLGGPCSPNHSQACASGGCVNGVCCAEPTCALGERCDIFGAEGRCLPPLQAGFACATNTDCLPGLQCRNTDGTGFRCFFLSVTPTPLPTAVSTAFIAATLAVGGDRAGYESGCAVSATPDACASWLLGLLAAWRVVRRGRSRSGG